MKCLTTFFSCLLYSCDPKFLPQELLGCDKCLYMCMDQSQLNNHEKNTHEVEKPKQVFICDICGAEYKSAGSLKVSLLDDNGKII